MEINKPTEGLAKIIHLDLRRINQYDSKGIKNLMKAVLERTMKDLRKSSYENSQDAFYWLMDNEISSHPFTFLNICENLNCDPEYIRRGIIGWANITKHKKDGDTACTGTRRYVNILTGEKLSASYNTYSGTGHFN